MGHNQCTCEHPPAWHYEGGCGGGASSNCDCKWDGKTILRQELAKAAADVIKWTGIADDWMAKCEEAEAALIALRKEDKHPGVQCYCGERIPPPLNCGTPIHCQCGRAYSVAADKQALLRRVDHLEKCISRLEETVDRMCTAINRDRKL